MCAPERADIGERDFVHSSRTFLGESNVSDAERKFLTHLLEKKFDNFTVLNPKPFKGVLPFLAKLTTDCAISIVASKNHMSSSWVELSTGKSTY